MYKYLACIKSQKHRSTPKQKQKTKKYIQY